MRDILILLEDIATIFDDHEYLGSSFEVSEVFSLNMEAMYE